MGGYLIALAVGRATFWGAIRDYVKKRTTRSDAAARIVERYHKWVTVFDGAWHPHSSAA